jgi:CHAT domain-containing protein
MRSDAIVHVGSRNVEVALAWALVYRRSLLGNMDFLRLHRLAHGEPGLISYLSLEIEERRLNGLTFAATPLYLERGRLYLSTGEIDQAEDDFLLGIKNLDRRQWSVAEREHRALRARQSFDDMLVLQAEIRHAADRALEFSEQAHAAEIPYEMSGEDGRAFLPSDLDRLRARLPTDVQILYYTVLPKETLVWVISSDEAPYLQLGKSADDLEHDTDALIKGMDSGASEEELKRLSSKLYRSLIQPLEARLNPSASLVIVPDKFLYRIPFSALMDPRSGRYLIEDHAIAIASTLSGLETGSAFDSLFRGRRGERALVVANPAVDRVRFPETPYLGGSEGEALQIAAELPGSEVLRGRGATKSAFLEGAGRYEIVHYSGHSLRSQLLFAADPEAGDDGRLFEQEIYGHRFQKTQLVVLAACRTASDRALSLASPFLAMGVPAVVASLWDVSDNGSVPLFKTFYHGLSEGAPAPEALRRAEISSLRSSQASLRNPRTWAAYEVIAGPQASQ